MLWLGLLMRDTGIPASKRLGIEDEVAALDFDLAVSYRLFLLRIEEQKTLAKRIGLEMTGSSENADDSIMNDRYVDNDTELW